MPRRAGDDRSDAAQGVAQDGRQDDGWRARAGERSRSVSRARWKSEFSALLQLRRNPRLQLRAHLRVERGTPLRSTALNPAKLSRGVAGEPSYTERSCRDEQPRY